MNDMITVRLGSELAKEELEQYAKNEGFRNVSDFVRTLIEERLRNTDTSAARLRRVLQDPEVLDIIRKKINLE